MKPRMLALLLIGVFALAVPLLAAKIPSRGTVNCSALNVRTGPGMSYSIVGLIHNGDEVTITDVSGSWYQVNVGSHQGKWVYSGYITVTAYGEQNEDEASKKPHATLYGTDPSRPEANAVDDEPLTRHEY